MSIPGRLLTTAMGVLPHTDVDSALELALSVDVPFWPQLPRVSYREDMYVQASSGFPGVTADGQTRRLTFSKDRFMAGLEELLDRLETPERMDLSREDSEAYHRFVELDLAGRPAIRGQLEGPVSLGFNVLDQDERPIIFDDEVRPLLDDFLAARANAQLRRLTRIHPEAFLFIDEPGLQFVWSGMSGYGDVAARRDLEAFLDAVDRPRGIHLCGNPDWGFLFSLDLDVVSLDVFTNGEVVAGYHREIRAFLDRGGTIVWGIVPTGFDAFDTVTLESLASRLQDLWRQLLSHGLDRELLLDRSLLSPATCCLVNPDGARTVEAAFAATSELSRRLRHEHAL